jgi:predicted small metal-binding protein
MDKVVNCPCREKITGENDDELVRLVQEHGKAVHQQDVSQDDALAMAQPAD